MAESAVLSHDRPHEATVPASAPAAVAPSTAVVIYAGDTLAADLGRTMLGRADVDRRRAHTAAEALGLVLSGRPRLLVVDEHSPDAEALVGAVRMNRVTRPVSIVVGAAKDFDPGDVRFLLVGANAILRPPAGVEWDERLEALLNVPPRREARLAVLVQYQLALYEAVHSVGGTALNVSENGMLLETDETLPMGIDVDVRIHLADGRAAPLVGCGQLVRREAARRSGVHFYGLEHDGTERLRHFVGRR